MNNAIYYAEVKIVDPITKGTGRGFNFIKILDKLHGKWSLSLSFKGKDNPLFKKLHENPAHVNDMPLILEFKDDENYLVKVDRVYGFRKKSNTITFDEADIEILDNLQFMRAVSKQRWLND